jgi:phosphopantothenoylcysteine decarboxylase/phosphopantothenate--cysteine ligase
MEVNDSTDDASHADGAHAPRVALGVSGGIAAYKAAEVLRGLQRAGCRVRVAMTVHATKLVAPLTFRALSGSHVVVDDYAPDNPDPIAHITFSQTIDLLVVAPATADIIAKFANGIADDFLSSTYLACNAPVLVAPAMNTTMWEHPATRRNLERLRADGVHIVEPNAGEMACGTIGPGRLSAPEQIVAAALDILKQRAAETTSNVSTDESHNGDDRSTVNDGSTVRDDSTAVGRSHTEADLAGERVLITAGATREEIDPVRFISNRSSGRMGFAVAEAARERGADVTVVAGVTTAERPAGVRFIDALSAEEMQAVVAVEAERATIFVAAAAVADYRPVKRAAQKIKKSNAPLNIELEPTPDILALVAASRRDELIVVGFAAESERIAEHAREKLRRKRLDAIVANDITRDGAGFDSMTNAVTIITSDRDDALELPVMPKLEAAHRILDEIARLRRVRSAKLVAAK